MKSNTDKKVLILGAGLVTRPAVRYLSQSGHAVTVASRTLSKAEALVSNLSNAQALRFDVKDAQKLHELVGLHDLTISLLPATHHLLAAEACLDLHKPMVTTSYVSPQMRAFDGRARKEGVLLLNELGLDPGIDHMSAMKIICEVNRKGGVVESFKSYCGGLPAPEANDNPWGYKFSWSPRGVVVAGTNSARYLEEGREINIPGPELFAHHWPVEVPDEGTFEAYPNRDSLGYMELYGLSKVKSMLRGTLRYPGWCDTWKKMVDLGLLDLTERNDLKGRSYRSLLASLLPKGRKESLEQDLARHLSIDVKGDVMHRLRWLGLLGEDQVPEEKTLLDVLAHRLNEKLVYARNEPDLIVLHHEFVALYPEGRQKITSSLVQKGVPGKDSAMSSTVSLPAAIGAKLVLSGEINETGVRIPVTPEIFEPILAELGQNGIVCREEFGPVTSL